MEKISTTIDITLVCGRRPSLLEQTLDSFCENVFANFQVGRVYTNIDPFCGNSSDGVACEKIIKSRFPNAWIHHPHTAGFGQAVKTLWTQDLGNVVFHLEDDWVISEPIFENDVIPFMEGNVTQVSLMCETKKRKRADVFHYVTKRKKIFGITYAKKRVPFFACSPSFFSGDFLKEVGALMDPQLDPEKQMSNQTNQVLCEYTSQFRNRLLFGRKSDHIVHDIGRDYRAEIGLTKSIHNGASIWKSE